MMNFTLRPLYLIPIEQKVAGPRAGLDLSEKINIFFAIVGSEIQYLPA
jgi:hypothetical protein